MTKKRLSFILGIIFIVLSLLSGKLLVAEPEIAQLNPGYYTVAEFFDGDTISVNMNGSVEKIRMIGVDTPETHDPRKPVQCFGRAASEFTKNLIGKQKVRLEADPLNTNRDRYDRLLRYVYLPNGTLVNAQIIIEGYGFAYTSFPMQKAEEFEKYETNARDNNLGLWGSCKLETDSKGYTNSGDESLN